MAAGLPGELKAVGEGAEKLERQRLPDEEFRVSGRRVKENEKDDRK